MGVKFLRDLNRPKKAYELNFDMSRELGYYYFKFDEQRVASGKDQRLIKRFDKKGIPLNETYIDVENQEYVYFPISIGQLGIAVFHTYLHTKSEIDKRRFLNFADWFVENANENNELGVRWLTNVPLPAYKNNGPWQSAFSQSRGISILLRAFQITNDKKYFKIAEKALIPFTKKVSEGGVVAETKWGNFYEEYTASVPTLVLNGMIFSLCGILDFCRVVPESKIAKKIFEDGITTLKNILPEYDLGYWSRYNLCKAEWYPAIDPATIGYQRLHVTQLNLMYNLTGEKIFKDYAIKFSNQDNLPNIIKMYKSKYQALRKIGRL